MDDRSACILGDGMHAATQKETESRRCSLAARADLDGPPLRVCPLPVGDAAAQAAALPPDLIETDALRRSEPLSVGIATAEPVAPGAGQATGAGTGPVDGGATNGRFPEAPLRFCGRRVRREPHHCQPACSCGQPSRPADAEPRRSGPTAADRPSRNVTARIGGGDES